jgi:hypothetical protein
VESWIYSVTKVNRLSSRTHKGTHSHTGFTSVLQVLPYLTGGSVPSGPSGLTALHPQPHPKLRARCCCSLASTLVHPPLGSATSHEQPAHFGLSEVHSPAPTPAQPTALTAGSSSGTFSIHHFSPPLPHLPAPFF